MWRKLIADDRACEDRHSEESNMVVEVLGVGKVGFGILEGEH